MNECDLSEIKKEEEKKREIDNVESTKKTVLSSHRRHVGLLN